MHRGGIALVVGLLAASLAAQDAKQGQESAYTTTDSPYMVELDFSLTEPVNLFVDIGGVRFDTLRIDPLGAVEEGTPARCQVTVRGSHVGGARPMVTLAALLEDANGRGLERLELAKFRPSRGRPFEEVQRMLISGSALLAARKIFVMIEVE